MHPLRIYLVFQALTAVVALAYAGVLSVDGIGWANWLAFWAALAAVGPVRTQLAWGPCWGAEGRLRPVHWVRVVLMGESVVHATAAAGIPTPGDDHPFVQPPPGAPEGSGLAQTLTGAEAVERDGEVVGAGQ